MHLTLKDQPSEQLIHSGGNPGRATRATLAGVAKGIHTGNSSYLALIDALVLLRPKQRNVRLKNPAKYSAGII